MADESILAADASREAQAFLGDGDGIFELRNLIIHSASMFADFSNRDAPRRSRGYLKL